MKQKLDGLLRCIRENRKAAILIGSAVSVIVLALLVVSVTNLLGSKDDGAPAKNGGWSNNGQSGKKQASGDVRGPASAGACKDGPLFNHIPMALSDFRAFRPLGFVTLPSHILGAKHSNFSINLPGESKKGLRVEFPSDAVVAAITSTESRQGNGYQMTFYPCSNFKSYFFHLGTISEKLNQEFTSGKATCQTIGVGADAIKKCQVTTEVMVKSGELAGTSDGFGGAYKRYSRFPKYDPIQRTNWCSAKTQQGKRPSPFNQAACHGYGNTGACSNQRNHMCGRNDGLELSLGCLSGLSGLAKCKKHLTSRHYHLL